MEAIFRDGSRQYRVREGDRVDVDFREKAEPGAELEFSDVLFVREGDGGAARIGKPLVDGAKISGKVIGHSKGPKLVVMKFRRRKNSKTRTGHRQRYTTVEISKIQG